MNNMVVEVSARNIKIANKTNQFDSQTASNLSDKNVAVISSATSEQMAFDLGDEGGLFTRGLL